MRRQLSFLGVIFTLLVLIAATPFAVRAEGDTPPKPEPIRPPWITGQNPNVTLSTGSEEEYDPSGVVDAWEGVEVPLLSEPPDYVDLTPQQLEEIHPAVTSLGVPLRYQEPGDVTCGTAALGMALEFLSQTGEGHVPSTESLVSDLKSTGLLYDTGTGVEELVYLARGYGYQGTTAFHNWTLEQITQQLQTGKPVVVTLGLNGESQPGHFVTVTGISADGQWISYNDPVLGKQTVSAQDFLKTWDQQGNSGLVVQSEPLLAVNDPMLPWMGLFGAMTILAMLVKANPQVVELGQLFDDIRSVLGSPTRQGLGGKLIAEGGSSGPPYSAPPGYKWDKSIEPIYGWKDIKIVEKVEVPNMVKTYGVVSVNRWFEKIPVYKTVRVDRGRWAFRSVKKYRTERYKTTQRYRVKKTYWYRRGYRLYRGTRYEWRTRTVWKTRRVPYYSRERYWVPKIVTEQRIDRYREVEHRDPVYGWKEVQKGTKTVERTKTFPAWKKVGSKVKWELKRVYVPTPTPPKPTPTPTSTNIPQYPTQGSTGFNDQEQMSTATNTPWPTLTPSPTPTPSSTPDPTATPTSQYNWLHYGTNTPAPTNTPEPTVPWSTQMAEREDDVSDVKTVAKGIERLAKLLDSGWARTGWASNTQAPGIISTALSALGLIRENQGASEEEVKTYSYGSKLANYYATTRVAYASHLAANLPTAGEILGRASQSATQPGVTNPVGTYVNQVGQGFSDEFAAISERVVPKITNPFTAVARVAQVVASGAGILAGGIQVKDGVNRYLNDDQHDETLGFVQGLGGLSTIAGSGITLGAALGVISAPVIVGAAPLLLGVGAIAAGGALAYDLLKDTQAVANTNQGIESWANKPGGFVDTAISDGQSMIENGVPAALAVPVAIGNSAVISVAKGVKNSVTKAVDNINNMVIEPVNNKITEVAEKINDQSQKVTGAIEDFFAPATDAINKFGTSIQTATDAVADIVPSPVKNAVESFGNSVQNAADVVKNTVENVTSGISNFFGGLFGSG